MQTQGENCQTCRPDGLKLSTVNGVTRVEVPQDFGFEDQGGIGPMVERVMAVAQQRSHNWLAKDNNGAGPVTEHNACGAHLTPVDSTGSMEVNVPEQRGAVHGSDQFTVAETAAGEVLGMRPFYVPNSSSDEAGQLTPAEDYWPLPTPGTPPATKFDITRLLLRLVFGRIEEAVYGPDITSGRANTSFAQGQCVLIYFTVALIKRPRTLRPDGGWRYVNDTVAGATAVVQDFENISAQQRRELADQLRAITRSSTCNYLVLDADGNTISPVNRDGTRNNRIDRVVLRCYRCDGACPATTGGYCETINTRHTSRSHLTPPSGAVDGVFCVCPSL